MYYFTNSLILKYFIVLGTKIAKPYTHEDISVWTLS